MFPPTRMMGLLPWSSPRFLRRLYEKVDGEELLPAKSTKEENSMLNDTNDCRIGALALSGGVMDS